MDFVVPTVMRITYTHIYIPFIVWHFLAKYPNLCDTKIIVFVFFRISIFTEIWINISQNLLNKHQTQISCKTFTQVCTNESFL